MNNLLRALAALFVVILVSGCGQSGPLYIPGNPSEIQAPPNIEQNNEDEKDETDEKDEDSTEEPEPT